MRLTCRDLLLTCIAISLCIILAPLRAQAPDTLWTREYGGDSADYGYAVRQTTDGGFIVTGWTTSFGMGSRDVYLIKSDSLGNNLWTKTYGGTDWDEGWSVQQTLDGGYVVVGNTYSFGSGSGDIFLLKINANGDTLWSRTYGGVNNDYGHSVLETVDGAYIVAGTTLSFGAGLEDFYLMKVDTLGNPIWTKTYGGPGHDHGYCVQQTHDGGYVLVGMTTSFGDFDVFLVKTDSAGDTLWTRTYGGSSYDAGFSVQQTSDSGYVISGYTSSFGAGMDDVYIIKTYVNGDTMWTRYYGGLAVDWGYEIQETFDGGFVVAGWTDSFGPSNDVYVIKTDMNGDTTWTAVYGGLADNAGFSAQQTTDGGYIIVGRKGLFGYEDVYLIKLASDVGVEEHEIAVVDIKKVATTIFRGPLRLPEGKKCKVYDITGRVVDSSRITRGIYFVEIDNEFVQKVVKIR